MREAHKACEEWADKQGSHEVLVSYYESSSPLDGPRKEWLSWSRAGCRPEPEIKQVLGRVVPVKPGSLWPDPCKRPSRKLEKRFLY